MGSETGRVERAHDAWQRVCEQTCTCDVGDNAKRPDIRMRWQAGGWGRRRVGPRWRTKHGNVCVCAQTNTCDACDNATHADITMRRQAGGWGQERASARWHATRSPLLPILHIGRPLITTPLQTTLCSWAGTPLGNPSMHILSQTSFVILLKRRRDNDVAMRTCVIITVVARTKCVP
jgi:hypothetical protein